MTYRKNFGLASIAALVTNLWCIPAYSESKKQTLFSHVRCAENMSCMANNPPMSFIVAEGPKISLVAPRDEFTLSDCTKDFFSRLIDVTISACEGYLNRGTGIARDRATAMFVLGHAYTRTREASINIGEPTESKAFQIWTKAAELDPTYIEPHISIGIMFGDYGEIDKAKAAFDRAKEINPKDWRIYTGLANVFFGLRTESTAANALEAAEQAAAIKPDEPYVRMVYGRMLQMNGRNEDAAKQYEAAVGNYVPSMDTSLELMREPNPLKALAYVYNQMGKPALAAETLSKYVDSVPAANRDYMLYQERAEYYESAGIFEKAAADFKDAAVRAPPEYAEDLTAKSAMLLAKGGAKFDAGKELRSVLARGSLKPTLKVQVFLRNQGYTDVIINGQYDGPTKRALDACLTDKACAPGVGQAI